MNNRYVAHKQDGSIDWAIGDFERPQPEQGATFLVDLGQNPRPPTPIEEMTSKLAAGLAVTSTGTPAISATYALDPVTLDQIRALAGDAKMGLGFPGGASTFDYPDATGTPRTFNATSIVNLYKALRDYVAALNTTAAILMQGGQAAWPAATTTIP